MDYENVDFISDVIALFSRIRKRTAIKLGLSAKQMTRTAEAERTTLLTESFRMTRVNPG